MTKAYQYLTDSLLHYKKSSLERRSKFLEEIQTELKALPAVINDKEQARNLYRALAFISQQITYANNLRKIENQEFIDMLADYNELGVFFAAKGYENLNDYFDIQKFKWRLKQPIDKIPPAVWDRFHRAQTDFLTSKGKQARIVPIDFSNPPGDQLYPLPQMFYNYENEAVDRIYVDKLGQFNMMVGPLGIQCPGGGMMPEGASAEEKASHLARLLDEKRLQMLDEYLEEENANLFQTAATVYNQIADQSAFTARLVASFSKAEFQALPNFDAFRDGFMGILSNVDVHSNAELLANVIKYIESYVKTGDEKAQSAQTKLINTLRATVQVETFKLHPMYAEAFQFVKDHSHLLVEVDQVNDVRRAGGHQTATTFLMDEPLENFFAGKGIQGQVPGDDMTGGKYKRFTLLQLLKNFDKVRFSHIMTVLAGQEAIFDNLDFSTVWNNDDYQSAKGALLKGAQEAHRSMLLSSGNLDYALGQLNEHQPNIKTHDLQAFLTSIQSQLDSEKITYDEVKAAIYNTLFLFNGELTLQEYRALIARPFTSQTVNEKMPTLLLTMVNEAILSGRFGETERQTLLLSNNNYTDAYTRLIQFYNTGHNALSSEIERMLDEAEALKSGNADNDRPLTAALYNTVFLLEGKKDINEYKQFAEGIQQGKARSGLKILAGIMLSLCIIAVAAVITLFAAPVVAAAVGALGVSTVIAGSVTGGVGVATGITSGVSFFASRQHGLSKAAVDLHEAYRLETHEIAEREVSPS